MDVLRASDVSESAVVGRGVLAAYRLAMALWGAYIAYIQWKPKGPEVVYYFTVSGQHGHVTLQLASPRRACGTHASP